MNLYDYYTNPSELEGFAERYRIVPSLVYNQILSSSENNKDLVELISTSPTYATRYAKEIIKGEFPAGEKAIATNPRQSLIYARDVIHKPFPLGEPIIATHDVVSVQYARSVLKGRFLLAEPVILTGRDITQKGGFGDHALLSSYFLTLCYTDDGMRERIKELNPNSFQEVINLFEEVSKKALQD
jgi:hypothetical protein